MQYKIKYGDLQYYCKYNHSFYWSSKEYGTVFDLKSARHQLIKIKLHFINHKFGCPLSLLKIEIIDV